MEITTSLKKTESSLMWDYRLEIPHEMASRFIDGSDRRIICTINGKTSIHTSLMPSGEAFFIMINKKLRDQLKLAAGSEVMVKLEKDSSEYGMEMPEEFATLLDQDHEGSEYFHALTPGKQRTLIYTVGKVKNPDSRLNKALAILFHLKEHSGKLDFKILNQTIKEFNQRGKLNQ